MLSPGDYLKPSTALRTHFPLLCPFYQTGIALSPGLCIANLNSLRTLIYSSRGYFYLFIALALHLPIPHFLPRVTSHRHPANKTPFRLYHYHFRPVESKSHYSKNPAPNNIRFLNFSY